MAQLTILIPATRPTNKKRFCLKMKKTLFILAIAAASLCGTTMPATQAVYAQGLKQPSPTNGQTTASDIKDNPIIKWIEFFINVLSVAFKSFQGDSVNKCNMTLLVSSVDKTQQLFFSLCQSCKKVWSIAEKRPCLTGFMQKHVGTIVIGRSNKKRIIFNYQAQTKVLNFSGIP